MKVLLAEDDVFILQGLQDILELEGYRVITAADGEAAWQCYQQQHPDFVCLDIMMPKLNGYDVCRKIRQQNQHIPVIFISAKSEEIDRVLGLELGADDFIVKPFGVKEVIARIRAVTRRYLLSQSSVVSDKDDQFDLDDLTVIPKELRAKRGSDNIELSLRDVKILQLLYQQRGQVVSREQLFNSCWGLNYVPNSRTLDQHISQLRKRIEVDPKLPRIIHTIHGLGYRYDQ